jgi:hypothetical protein
MEMRAANELSFFLPNSCLGAYLNNSFPLQCFFFQDVHFNPCPLEEEDNDHQFLSEEPLQLLTLQVAAVYFQFAPAQ